MDDSRPEAFFALWQSYSMSHQNAEAEAYLERVTERFALVALTYVLAGQPLKPNEHLIVDYPMRNWIACTCDFAEMYVTNTGNDVPKPEWYCNDALVKLVTKVAFNNVVADTFCGERAARGRVAVLCALVHVGMINEGKFIARRMTRFRTTDEFLQGVRCFEFAAAVAEIGYVFGTAGEQQQYTNHAEAALLNANLWQVKEHSIAVSAASAL